MRPRKLEKLAQISWARHGCKLLAGSILPIGIFWDCFFDLQVTPMGPSNSTCHAKKLPKQPTHHITLLASPTVRWDIFKCYQLVEVTANNAIRLQTDDF